VLGSRADAGPSARAREFSRELDRSQEPDRDPAASGSPPRDYPLDYLDKLCLAGTCRDHATSAAPVWQLYVEGDLNPRVLARALARLVRRYPVLASHVAAADSREDWDTARALVYRVDPSPELSRMLRVVDLRDAASGAFRTLQRSLFDHHMDLTRDYPLQLTWARTGDDSGVLFVQQHHGIADGLAFFDLLDDLCKLYDASEVDEPGESSLTGLELIAPPAPVLRISEAEMIEPRRWRRPWLALLGFGHHLRRLARLVLTPVDQLYCNRWSDEPGRNDVLHYHLDDSVLDIFREIKQQEGFSTNDLLTAALGLALARWSADHDTPVRRFNVLSPADMRPRHDPPRSFANHLSSYLVDFDRERMPDARSTLEAVHRQVRQQALIREPHKKLLAENSVARFTPVRWINKAIYRARSTPLNYSFSNLIPISPKHHGGMFGTRTWTASHLRILTPNAYLNGTNTTVIRYAGRLCFNFNFKDGVIPREHVGQLVEHFGGALAEVVAAARNEEPRPDLLPAPLEVTA
jgi:Condensation domain